MSKKAAKTTEQEKPKTKYDRKMEARRKEAARQKREALTFRIVCMVIAIAIIGTAGYFGVTRVLEVRAATNDPYVSIGDHELTQLEYDYHFNTTVNNYVNTYSYYLSYFGLDITQPFEEQNYSEEMTWQEYFEQSTLEQLRQTYALYDDAKANGFEYDTKEDYDTFVATAKETAKDNQITMLNYYKTMFGEYATANNVKPLLETDYYVNAYYEKLLEDNTPTEAAATEYYEDHKGDYDRVSYYSFLFDPANYEAESDSLEDTSNENNEEDSAEDTSNESNEDNIAFTLAEKMKERLENGEDFETLCMEYATEDAKANYEAEDSEYSLTENMTCSTVNSTFQEWISDESRKEGDITVIQAEDSGLCYVLKFVSRTYDENCLDSISSTLASDAVSEYMDSLLEEKYEIKDIKGEIGYLNKDADGDE